jgi:lipopolysaccharide transport system ATP-binding protein
MKPILEIHNVSKLFRIRNAQKADTLREQLSINYLFSSSQRNKTDFWALKDISFTVMPGETLGIIGKNGAGKSTLLKILSRITSPTSGRILARGRMASLLEVGTGFHPELTGRENIYLNGAILGMRKHEIRAKIDAIIDFSGTEQFIETPLKHFSSGMQLRLAFAVAAFLEPEILVIDEVLAVGDSEFQKRCLGKMEEVSKSGRTILFVSHQLAALESLCKQSILLQKGNIICKGSTNDVITEYLRFGTQNCFEREDVTQQIGFKRINIQGHSQGTFKIDILIESETDRSVAVDIRLKNYMLQPAAFGSLGTLDSKEIVSLRKGQNKISLILDLNLVSYGSYYLSFDLTEPFVQYFDRIEDCLNLVHSSSSGEKKLPDQSWNLGSCALPITLERFE